MIDYRFAFSEFLSKPMARAEPVLLMARHLDQGGTERQLAAMAKALDRRLFSPHVGAFRSGGVRWPELETAGIPLVDFSIPTLSGVRGVFTIASYIRRHGIRLVHAFDTAANAYGVPAAMVGRADVVLSSQRVHRCVFPKLRGWLRATDLLVNGVVVNCEFMRRHLIEDEHVPASRIHLCYNGVDTSVFHAAGRSRPEALSTASLVVGVVSALRPEKDLETLLEGFARLGARQAGVKLVIVGGGYCEPALRARAAALGISQDCLFQPPTSDVAPWLRAIDIFVLPSVTEALSNSLMEAMACGCCVVASRVGGSPELVTDGETGLLFDPGDVSGLVSALDRLTRQPSLRAELASNAGRLMPRKFSLEMAARRLEEIYTMFLSSAR